MKLAPDHRQAIEDLIEDAHSRWTLSSEIAATIVDGIEDLERFGHDWPPALLRELAIKGAAQMARDWRRRQTTVTETAKGTTVPLPVYAAVRTSDGYAQMRLADMTAAQLRAHRERLSAQRNTFDWAVFSLAQETLSKEVQYVTDLLDVMAEMPAVTTAGAAERVLRERAA